MILYNLTEEELNIKAEELLSNTDISHDAPGSRAKAILAITNNILGTFYETLDFNITMAFLSKAQGQFLDEIGYLLNCSRLTGEEDENYRYRISNQVYVVEGCNETAIRLACLAVDNVADVLLTPYTFGTGSFSVHVVATNYSLLSDTLVAVQEVLNDRQAFGIKGVALAPKMVKVKLKLLVSYDKNSSSDEQQSIASGIQSSVASYIDNIAMGGEMILSEIVTIAKETDRTKVRDVTLISIDVNDLPVVLTNYSLYWDEKLYLESVNSVELL